MKEGEPRLRILQGRSTHGPEPSHRAGRSPYLGEAPPRDKNPCSCGVHLFSSRHEPYEMHADHPVSPATRGSTPYDSERSRPADRVRRRAGEARRREASSRRRVHRQPRTTVRNTAITAGPISRHHGLRGSRRSVYRSSFARRPGSSPASSGQPVQTIDLLADRARGARRTDPRRACRGPGISARRSPARSRRPKRASRSAETDDYNARPRAGGTTGSSCAPQDRVVHAVRRRPRSNGETAGPIETSAPSRSFERLTAMNRTRYTGKVRGERAPGGRFFGEDLQGDPRRCRGTSHRCSTDARRRYPATLRAPPAGSRSGRRR